MTRLKPLTLADKIVVLRDGNIEQVGSPLELYRNPDNRFVAGFIGSPSMNFLEAKIENGSISVAGLGNAAVPTDARLPGRCRLGDRGHPAPGPRNQAG